MQKYLCKIKMIKIRLQEEYQVMKYLVVKCNKFRFYLEEYLESIWGVTEVCRQNNYMSKFTLE